MVVVERRSEENALARTHGAVKRARWCPLLQGAIAERAKRAVRDIASDLAKLAGLPTVRSADGGSSIEDASLACGGAGLAVFYAYMDRVGRGSRYRRASLDLLEHAADEVASVTMNPSLYGGFTGVAWAMAHLEGRVSGLAESFSTRELDAALRRFVRRRGWKRDYDLVSGLVGLGVYGLERLPAPAAVSIIEGVIDRLEETAERRPDGITWHTAPELLPPAQRKRTPHGHYNLGLAHGVPGAIAFFGAAWVAGVRRRKARELLDGAVAWLLHQTSKDPTGSRFPAWLARGRPREDCRSAWCYGDPGVAAALMCAAQSVGESAWEREALKIAYGAVARPPDETGIVNAGLCHGAAGLGHVFNRMYQATGDAELARAARYWFRRALAMRRKGRGFGGFSALSGRADGTYYWEDDPGILMGSAGIALALLAATTSTEPEWDRMLLLSTRNRR
jgi:lantibiotic modifying enzyme